MPDLYRHPSPSSTNPYWQADIVLGPAPTSRNGKSRKTPTSDSQRGVGQSKGSRTQSTEDSRVASSTNVAVPYSMEGRNDSKYSFAQQQRHDEALWGSEASETPVRSHYDRPSLRVPPMAHIRDTSAGAIAEFPSINDMHPATVTKVNSREDAAWMMQPPPIAEVMEGKQSLPSRSGTSSSRLSAHSVPMSREGSKTSATRISTGGSRASNHSQAFSANSPQGQRHDRLNIEERDFATTPSKRERRRPSPIQIKDPSEESEITILHRPSRAPQPVRVQRVASRPQLSTIVSDSIVPSQHQTDYRSPSQTSKENSLPPSNRNSEADASSESRDRTSRRPGILVSDSPLKVLQELTELTPRAPIFNTRIFTATSPAIESKVLLPVVDGEEERRLTGGPELFDSWYTPDFELGEWVHQHTKREVRHRWSMDI
jgi:hypothetical protein